MLSFLLLIRCEAAPVLIDLNFLNDDGHDAYILYSNRSTDRA
jgi:hypothetical protein